MNYPRFDEIAAGAKIDRELSLNNGNWCGFLVPALLQNRLSLLAGKLPVSGYLPLPLRALPLFNFFNLRVVLSVVLNPLED
jgi:hypothetical protein